MVEIPRMNDMDLIRAPDGSEDPEVTGIKHLERYRVHFTFWDGTEADLDLEPLLRGLVFEPLRRDPSLFAQMYLENGSITWPNGADMAPETLYELALGIPYDPDDPEMDLPEEPWMNS